MGCLLVFEIRTIWQATPLSLKFWFVGKMGLNLNLFLCFPVCHRNKIAQKYREGRLESAQSKSTKL